MIGTILMVFAFVLACCAAAGVPLPHVHLGWAAVACFFLAQLLGGVHIR